MIAELCVVLGQLFCAWDSDKRSEYQDMCKPSVLSALEWDKFECTIPQCRLDTMLYMPQLAQIRQVRQITQLSQVYQDIHCIVYIEYIVS